VADKEGLSTAVKTTLFLQLIFFEIAITLVRYILADLATA
jgi:hypothetical protein